MWNLNLFLGNTTASGNCAVGSGEEPGEPTGIAGCAEMVDNGMNGAIADVLGSGLADIPAVVVDMPRLVMYTYCEAANIGKPANKAVQKPFVKYSR